MRSNSLFKLQTTVLATILLFTMSAQAQDNSNSNYVRCDATEQGVIKAKNAARDRGITFGSGISSLDDLFDSAKTSTGTPLSRSDIDAIQQGYEQGATWCINGGVSVGMNSASSCVEAGKAYNEALTKFNDACGKAGLGASGSKSCYEEVAACNEYKNLPYSAPSSSSPDILKSFQAGFNGQAMNTSKPRAVVPDLEAAETAFEHCGMLAAQDYDSFSEAVENTEEKNNDLRQRLIDMQNELVELQTEQAEKMKSIKDEMTATQQQAEDDAEAIRLELQEFEEGLANQVTQLEGAIAEQNRKIDELGGAQVDAYNAYQQAHTTLNLQCHGAALTKVQQLQQAKQALIAQSRYSAGGFNKLMGSVGLSNEKAAEKLAASYYKKCTADRAYIENLNIAKRTRDAVDARANRAIAAARENIQAIQKQIERLQGELKLKGLENFSRRLERLNNRLVTRMQQLQEDFVLQGQRFAQLIANKQQAMQQLQSELATNENYLEQRRAYLDLKTRYSGGRNVSDADISTLFSTKNDLSSKASDVTASCGGIPNNFEAADMCRKAAEFVSAETIAYGSSAACERGLDDSYVSPTSTTPAPTVPAPTNTPTAPSSTSGTNVM